MSTGSYLVSTEQRPGVHSEQLIVDLELQEGREPSDGLAEKAAHDLTLALSELNTEFRKLHKEIGDAALPVVRLYPKGMLPTRNEKSGAERSLLQITGKKPRVILAS